MADDPLSKIPDRRYARQASWRYPSLCRYTVSRLSNFATRKRAYHPMRLLLPARPSDRGCGRSGGYPVELRGPRISFAPRGRERATEFTLIRVEGSKNHGSRQPDVVRRKLINIRLSPLACNAGYFNRRNFFVSTYASARRR